MHKSGRFLKPGFTVLLSVASLVTIAFAGSLTPPAAPASTFHTLEEIYNSIAGTFDSSSITSSTTGSLIQGIKSINSNLAWASSSNNIWALNSGNVGLGTTAPETKLHVQGSTPIITLKNTSLVSQTWQFRNGSLAVGSRNFDIYDRTASASRLVIQDDGNVMIGSSSNPANNSRVFIFGGTNGANVDVRGKASVADQAAIELEGSDYDTTPNSALLQYYGPNGTGTTMGFANQRLGVLRFVSATTALIATNNSTGLVFGTNDTERMRLSGGGFLGIGTTSPTTKLEVQGTSSASYGLYGALQVAGFSSVSYSRFGTATATDSTLDAANDLLISGSLEVDGTFRVDGNASHSLAGEWIFDTSTLIVDSGTDRVGIGTTAPFAKLQVRGGILTDSITLASSSASVITAQTGVQGFTLFSGGIGTANGPTPAIRLTPTGNLVNIGSIRAGDTLLTGGGTLATPVTYSTGTATRGVALGDLNGDNKLDAVASNFTSGNVSVLIGNGNGTFDAAVNHSVNGNPRIIRLSDFNGDGKLDAAVANSGSHNVSVLIGKGDGSFSASASYAVASSGSPVGLAVADLNGDGRPDIATANSTPGNVSVLINNGNGTFSTHVEYSVGGSGNLNVMLADLNGDGKNDIVTSNFSSANISVLLNNGNGTFGSGTTYSAGTNPYPVSIADVNSDGSLDVAVANYGSDNISIFINNGDGTLAAVVNYGVGDIPQGIILTDLNGDGKADIANTDNNAHTVTTYMNSGTGTFVSSTSYSVLPASFPLDITAGDLNGDGKNDVVSANSGSGNISVFLNQVTDVFYAKTSTGRVSIGTSSTKSKFTIVDTGIGSVASGSFAIRSSNTLGSAASISATALSGGSVFNLTLPASSSANNAHGLLLAQDVNGVVIASWSMGGKLALRSQILSRGAVSNCTGVNTPTSGCIDYAESFPSNDPTLEAGEVVSSDLNNPSYVVRAASSSSVLGIVSTSPAALIDGNAFKTGAGTQNRELGSFPIALAGRVPLKISLENGDIQAGDHLSVSATKPGFAAKAITPGMTVGIALEPANSSSQSDKILVFVNLDYWVPDIAMVSGAPTDQLIETGGVRLDAGIIFDSIISRFEKLLGIVFKNGLVQSIKGVFGIVETDRLCLGSICITENELRNLLQRSNVPQAIPTIQPTPTPTPTDTPIPYVDPTPTPTVIPPPTPAVSETPTASPVETLPTVSPSVTPEPTVTPTPDLSPTPAPTPTPTPVISTPEPTPVVVEVITSP